MPKLRVALVGCGLISESHARAYLAHADRAEIVACCDADAERASARAKLAGGARVFADYRDVLADPGIDSVDILTPHHLHREQAIAALDSGKHVLLQKPLGTTLKECREIVRAAHATDRVLYYGEMQHTDPAVLLARKLVREGAIGPLVATQGVYAHWQGGEYLATRWRYDPAISGGGQLLDGGIHQVSTMVTVAGRISSVSAVTTRFREELGGEDTAALAFRYECGALGVFLSTHASGAWPQGPRFTAMGPLGAIALGGDRGAVTIQGRGEPEVLMAQRGDVFASMVGSYLDTIGGARNPSPPETGLHEFEVVAAAYRAAETGITQHLG